MNTYKHKKAPDMVFNRQTIRYNENRFNKAILTKFEAKTPGSDAYRFLTVNKEGKYVFNTVGMSPMIFQAGMSGCSWSPTHGLMFGQESDKAGAPVHVAVEFCKIDLIDTCFEDSVSWTPNGKLKIDQAVVNALTELVNDAITAGSWLTLINGSAYSKDDVDISGDNTAEEIKLFQQTIGAHVGIVPMLKKGAIEKGLTHWNVPGLFKQEHMDGKAYVGDVVKDLFLPLLASAPEDMSSDIIGVPTDYVMQVDQYTYSRLVWQKDNECVDPLRKCQSEINLKDVNGIPTYYIKGVKVEQNREVTFFDKFTKKVTRYAAITKKKNFAIGSSARGKGSSKGYGLRFFENNEGIYKLVGDFLFISHIVNKNEVVSTQQRFEKA